jgi:hypothetical protein
MFLLPDKLASKNKFQPSWAAAEQDAPAAFAWHWALADGALVADEESEAPLPTPDLSPGEVDTDAPSDDDPPPPHAAKNRQSMPTTWILRIIFFCLLFFAIENRRGATVAAPRLDCFGTTTSAVAQRAAPQRLAWVASGPV